MRVKSIVFLKTDQLECVVLVSVQVGWAYLSICFLVLSRKKTLDTPARQSWSDGSRIGDWNV